VYCLEQADLPPEAVLEDVRLDPEAPVVLALANGLDPSAPPVTLLASGSTVTTADASPHRTAARDTGTATPITLRAVPYFLWGSRAKGAMRVWIPLRPGGAPAAPGEPCPEPDRGQRTTAGPTVGGAGSPAGARERRKRDRRTESPPGHDVAPVPWRVLHDPDESRDERTSTPGSAAGRCWKR
jgi:hypothetical protein